MTATTHPEFSQTTEALDVAKAFPDRVHGRTILVTGVNLAGIGFTTAQAFASQAPANLILTGRSTAKVQECIDALKQDYPSVNYRVLQLDLSSQKAVRKAADEVLSWDDIPAIDVIVNNAGIMFIPKRTITEDGIELHFATNHIGHFLFTCLVMPKLIKAAESNPKGATRVINVSAGSPQVAAMRWSDRNFEKLGSELPEAERPNYRFIKMFGLQNPEEMTYIPLEAYNQTKVANLLFSVGLTNHMLEKHGILSMAVHPGVLFTELGRNMSADTLAAINGMKSSGAFHFKTQGAGASTNLVAALDPQLSGYEQKENAENYGAYLADCQICEAARPEAISSEQAEKLWKLSEELVHQKFEWS
ncbi:putative short-chain dehydrogenase [Stachybotrys elegans]|uniref:Short-chain dehydrogenase n=1 Tax=Stachybotrys elegans TaxID=80388 RepID=A0A8K0SE99_9HYPO|nr:putative short-chain dehydrogenase [Stachybotrys elegans]